MQNNISTGRKEEKLFDAFLYTTSHRKLLESLDFNQATRYWQVLKRLHDMIMYNPEVELDGLDRIDLLEVKVLSDYMYQIQMEIAIHKGELKKMKR